MKPDHYDAFADRYEAENASSLLNAHYERPAILALAGEVSGLAVLDAGCGSGPLTAALRDRGALVTGFDGSPAMVELARQRLGEDVPLHVADLAEPLPFADDAFDLVVASLVLSPDVETGRSTAEKIPVVTLQARPSGVPTAMSGWPTTTTE